MKGAYFAVCAMQALLIGGGLAVAGLQMAAIYIILSLILRIPIKRE